MFYAGTSHLAERCKQRDVKELNKRISLLTYLGLINKLSDDEIPPFLLQDAEHYMKQNKRAHRVSFYSIPPYDEDTLAFAEAKALKFKEKGFTMKAWSRELLLRTLGEEEANRVYPQRIGTHISQFNELSAKQMEQVTLELIYSKGWTTEQEITRSLNLRFVGQKQYKEKHLKRILPEMLEKYGLSKIRLNNILKREFGITDSLGYPHVIMRTPEEQLANVALDIAS